MTQINRFVKRDPLEFNLYKPPAQAFLPLFEKLDKKYTESRQTADAINAAARVPHLDQDTKFAVDYMQSVSDRIDDILKRHNNNYLTAYDELMTLKQQVVRETAPGTQPYTIVQNYETFMKADEENRKALAEGKITQAQYDGFRNYAQNVYKGAQPKGQYGFERLVLPSIVPYVNVDVVADSEFKSIPVRTTKTAVPTYNFDKGYYEISYVETKYIDRQEASDAIKNTLEANPAITQFLRQQALFEGKNVNTAVDDYIKAYLDKQIPVRTGTISKIKEYQVGMFPPKAADTNVSVVTSNLSYGATTAPSDSAPQPIDITDLFAPQQADDFKKQVAKKQWDDIQSLRAAQQAASIKEPGGVWGGPVGSGIDAAGNLENYFPQVPKAIDPQVIFKSPEEYAHMINVPLLRSIVATTQTAPGTPQYMREVWTAYNANVGRSFANAVNYWDFATPEARDAALLKVYQDNVNSPNTPLYRLDKRTGKIEMVTSASERKKFFEGMVVKPQGGGSFTAKDLNTSDYQMVGISAPVGGGVPLAYYVRKDTYDYFVPSRANDALFFNFGSTNVGEITTHKNYAGSIRYNAFGFYQYGREAGFPFQMMEQEKDRNGIPTGKSTPIWLVGRLDYVPQAPGKFVPRVTYHKGKWEKGKFVTDLKTPYKVDGQVLTPEKLNALITLPLVNQYYSPMQGASRSSGGPTFIESSMRATTTKK